MTEVPVATWSRTSRKNRATASPLSGAEGSSRMSSVGSTAKALALSSRCRWATVSVPASGTSVPDAMFVNVDLPAPYRRRGRRSLAELSLLVAGHLRGQVHVTRQVLAAGHRVRLAADRVLE